jgi:hypothetical protein
MIGHWRQWRVSKKSAGFTVYRVKVLKEYGSEWFLSPWRYKDWEAALAFAVSKSVSLPKRERVRISGPDEDKTYEVSALQTLNKLDVP